MAFSLKLSADFNQAAECLPFNARGRQCVPNCVMFLITVKYIKALVQMQKEDLHDIMFAGSHLYNSLHATACSSGLVDPTNIAAQIKYKGESVTVKQKCVFPGFVGNSSQIDGQTYFSLETAVNLSQASSCDMIMVFSGLSIGIHVDGTLFYIFDSHARNADGMSCPTGTCVLGRVQSVEVLCSYLRSLALSVGETQLDILQFDLHSFSFTISDTNAPFVVYIIDDRLWNKIKHVGVSKRRALNNKETVKRRKMAELLDGRSCAYIVDDQHIHRTVEQENGQTMFSLVKTADFNQDAECLPGSARGRQSVPNCVIFFITLKYIKAPVQILKEDLHDIMYAGSHLYNALNAPACSSGLNDQTNLQSRIRYKGKTVTVKKKCVFSGFVGNCSQIDGQTYFSLETAVNLSQASSCDMIMVFSGLSIGIHVDGTLFYIFDSHARNADGMSCPTGTCVLGRVQSVEVLCSYLRSLALSVGETQLDILLFDLQLFSFTTRHANTPFIVHILDDRLGYKIKPGKLNKQIAAKGEKSSLHGVKHGQDQRCAVQELMLGNSYRHVIDDRHYSTAEPCISENLFEGHDVYSLFKGLVSHGPEYVCSCCTQTFFRHSVKNVATLAIHGKDILHKHLQKYISVDSNEWICQTCLTAIKLGKTPTFWLNNGLKYPVKPAELDLSNLEERLVSPRLPFMQLQQMPRGGQINLKGNVVNVPADVNGTIKSLPRMVNDSETIMLKLKRRLSYKHHVAFENVRPNKVFDAAKWLIHNSSLFRNEGIVVDETWLQTNHQVISSLDDATGESDCGEGSDAWTEEDDFPERMTGNMDTFLQSLDFREFNQILCVAPGENNSPIGLFYDYHSEALSFPSIFCGQQRANNTERKVPLHYSAICKWELRNVDRRVAVCLPNIFFKLKRLQIKQIRDKVSLAVRKCKTKGASLTAGDVLTPGFVDKLTMQDDGYRVLRTLRGSPPYWEKAKKDVFAMIRQLGIPTWFCSFSAAETKWEPLLRALMKLVHGKELSSQEIQELTWQEKCMLIKSDPVTCARYFDFRVQTFIKHVLKNKLQPIGEIVDFFYRVEFQQRGSPHIHMLMWIKGAPVYGIAADLDISGFVDKYVTCFKDETISTLINYQTHRHAKTCRKRGKNICRFNFPIPPMPKTIVLHPLENDNDASLYTQNYEKIMSFLDTMYKTNADTCLQFSEFLAKLEMTIDAYMKAISSTIKRPKVFLKRSLSELRINNYNRVLIACWEANMDIQYILDPFACVSYIVSYISKGQRGLSNLIQDACTEAREMDSDIRQQVRRIGNQFLNSVEIGAQEAVYLVLQMPLRRCTRDVVFVDTSKPDDRTSLLKSWSELKDLPKNSKHVESDNVLKRYKRRPKLLEQLCYADFVAWYELCRKQKPMTTSTLNDGVEELPETNYDFDHDDDIENNDIENDGDASGKVIQFPCGTQVRKRSRQKVIYSHSTSINNNSEEHFREKIMLFSHWRNDTHDLLHGYRTFEQSYHANQVEISVNKLQYEKIESEEYETLILESAHHDQYGNVMVHPEGQYQDLIDAEEGTTATEIYGCFDPGVGANAAFEDYDIGEDIGAARQRVANNILPHNEVNNDNYLKTVCELNPEQKTFFYHIIHKVKTGAVPFYTFLSGGAGVGKSVLIKAVYQALLKYFNHLRDQDPNTTKVLLCAPTGKAAHNIGGSTIHSAFCIPVSQGFHFKPLDMQQLNTMRARFHDLRVVIIDEISMVGRNMMNFINLRLQEIMGTTVLYGGLSILAVGDLFQLKPVFDSWIFSQFYNTAHLSCMATNLWVELFDFFELQTVMRQKDDHAFALLLNRLRECSHTDEDIETLRKQQINFQGNKHDDLKDLPHLFCRKKDVFAHNTSILSNMIDSNLVHIDAIDSVSGDLNKSLTEVVLSKIPKDASKTMNLSQKLTLGLGLPSEICLNVDTDDGVTNGASCFVKKFDFRVQNSCRCSIVWVLFDDISIGKKWRLRYNHLYQKGIDLSWTPILETCRHFTIQYYKTYVVTRRQFPIQMSAGKTIHKAQGSTIKTGAVLHFGSSRVDHIHYVGLSRVTSLSDVHILELNEDKISVSQDVAIEMERLRSHRCIQPAFPDLSLRVHGEITVCFQNCRSLRKHFTNIKHESNLMKANVVGFVETRVSGLSCGTNRYAIDGFDLVCSERSQSAHGIAVYHRNIVRQISVYTFGCVEVALAMLGGNFFIGFVYCPPKSVSVANFEMFLQHLSELLPENAKIVLLGDFNYDYKTAHSISQLFRTKLQLHQIINTVTTDYGTYLDHIYTNLAAHQLSSYGTLESYYSDHKPLYLVVKIET